MIKLTESDLTDLQNGKSVIKSFDIEIFPPVSELVIETPDDLSNEG